MAAVEPVIIECEEDRLIGILHKPEQQSVRGLLLVVGGPQYRIGSHRQFILLARFLAENGVAVLRFDYRGMGDSSGEQRTFEDIEQDIRSAIDKFFEKLPVLEEVVIWGLCDAASAAIFYAHKDSRVTGIAILNPWIRTEQGVARSYLLYYYPSQLFNPNLWRRILKGEFGFKKAFVSFIGTILSASGLHVLTGSKETASDSVGDREPPRSTNIDLLPDRMANSLEQFQGHLLLVLSGDDLIAAEFKEVVNRSRRWRRLLRKRTVTRFDLPASNHTFARKEWRNQVAAWTVEWIDSW